MNEMMDEEAEWTEALFLSVLKDASGCEKCKFEDWEEFKARMRNRLKLENELEIIEKEMDKVPN